ncbi:alpha-amylase family glycosyl hydrolase [Robertkochia aurantiaca]|uniref:alpha-amylase family glycosyl hydrolase n=1 Tax=Robertkochia aurantiaca TaxID=2873700 RepID=UPI001CCDEA52|nr:alpha-amylase family glycosyl hydrolase [Robertkochia sp. 3YJGBD-33]
MKKLLLLLISLFSVFSWAQQQEASVTVNPATFGENDQITITFTDIDPAAWGVSDLYLWAWSFDENDQNIQNSPNNGTWESSNEAQKLTDNGDGTFSITFVPSTFYDRSPIGRIGFLAKAKDGTGDKKTQDFLYEVGGYVLNLTSPAQTTTVVQSGTGFNITAETSLSSDFTLTANGQTVNTASGVTAFNYTYTVTETTNFTLSATDGNETLSESFTAVVSPTVTEEPLPTGLKDGINFDPNDNTHVTLVLYAPQKEFVHVIGDFTNWQINDNYLMKKDPATDRFWIEITGLTPQFDHMFQYMVESSINIADPYSTTILDPFNDQYITEVTYPGLPAYPEGQTTEAVTLLRTGQPEFNWSDNTLNFQPPKRKDLVIYELLIRDFDELHSFDAVKARLDYLETLGVNAIELMPVNEFDGNESWGYNPSFHMALDKYYGTPEAFKQLIDECHRRGMAVIIDVVYNHATGQHPYFRMWNTSGGGTGGTASQDNPFFNAEAKHSYSVFNDFNHQSQATRDYVNQTVQYWIEEFKVDGFRWDLTKGFTQNCGPSNDNCTNSPQADRIEVLKGYADTQWASNDDFMVIFEHLGTIEEESQWAEYRLDEGKGIMLWNKQTTPYNEATMGYHDSGKSDFSGVSYQAKGFSNPAAISYMESHDEERLMFKNLQFGNATGGYDVTNLNTALSRMEIAGAFFFTVPGPKMIWQFGELGYEVSIDENGRTGNKPIRWEYFDVTERRAIYETWSDLNKLTVGEAIFESENFTLDLNGSSGLKRIHLANTSAGTDEIALITIVGNFGLTEQDIVPGFQQTGVWYEVLEENKKFVVTDPEATITLAPGEFRIFADKPSALFPNTNPPDEDSDGVIDADDLCPGTTLGATVDVTGCEIFTLPTSNYSIQSTGETCSNADNGVITVSTEQALDYTVNLSGNGITLSENFSGNQWIAADLPAGTYQLCFTLSSEPDYEQCFEITIGEPEDLAVFSQVNEDLKTLNLELKGSDLYYIELNGVTTETRAETISLELQDGLNTLKVRAAKSCQGVYEETFMLSQGVFLFPNPVRDIAEILFTQQQKGAVTFKVFAMNGQVVQSGSFGLQNSEFRKSLDLGQLQPGLYLLELRGTELQQTIKIIKQ